MLYFGLPSLLAVLKPPLFCSNSIKTGSCNGFTTLLKLRGAPNTRSFDKVPN